MKYKDKVCRIFGKKVVKTGIRIPGSSGYNGEFDDYEPSYLRDAKTHIILQLDTYELLDIDGVWIEECNIELVK